MNVDILRALQGVAATSGYVAICSIGADLYPQKIALVMSVIEIAFYSGFALGPPIGNLLYDIMGFQLPFVTIGVFNIASACILCLAMPGTKSQNDLTNSGGRDVYGQLLFQVDGDGENRIGSIH